MIWVTRRGVRPLIAAIRLESGIVAWMTRVGAIAADMPRRDGSGAGERLGRVSQEWLEQYTAESVKHDSER